VNIAPVPAESTAGIKLAGRTEGVTVAKIEALGRRTEHETDHGYEALPLECPRESERRPAYHPESESHGDPFSEGGKYMWA
jgi:hypothetical protein